MKELEGFDGIELRRIINKHILSMLKQATEALKNTAFIQATVEEKAIWLWNENKGEREKNDKGIKSVDNILILGEDEFKQLLSAFIADDYREPEEGGIVAFQFYLFIGIRYYQKRLEDNDFFIMSDLPELLTIDERMSSLFSTIKVCSTVTDRIINSKIRTKKSATSKKEIAKKTELSILKTMEEMNSKDSTERALHGWVLEIYKNSPLVEPPKLSSITTIIKTNFAEKLTKGARGKYKISEFFS